jgi:hypothetical protein
MWRRRDFLQSSVIGLAFGPAFQRANAGTLSRPQGEIVLDEAAEVLGAVAAHGGALDALLHGRRELYSVARDQLRAAGNALIRMTENAERARASPEDRNHSLLLRRLAVAAGLHADRLDDAVRHDAQGALKDSLADPAPDRSARRGAPAARAWRRACGGRGAETEMVLAGPVACALEAACFYSRRDALWKRSVLDSYATSFEAGLARMDALLKSPTDRAALAAAARARAAAAEALGLVRSARDDVPCRQRLQETVLQAAEAETLTACPAGGAGPCPSEDEVGRRVGRGLDGPVLD